MRTNFTAEDIKNIIDTIFNGNLWLSKATKGQVPYKNPNSEQICLIDTDNDFKREVDIAEYLNIHFYSWKQRLIDKGLGSNLTMFDEWVESLNFSMDESYALVEIINEEVTASQDIDSSSVLSKVTFLIQTDKIKNLDYYVSKLKNAFLGSPQDIQNAYGEQLKALIRIGILNYEQEPFVTQLGECVIITLNLRISYLTSALTYSDTEIEISLTEDDEYSENGEIIGETNYMKMPITKATFQNIFVSNPLPTVNRPDLTGFVASSLTTAKTFSFFDFTNSQLSMALNELFWSLSAHKINGKESQIKNVNIPIYIRIKSNDKYYVYKDMIDNMQKTITNNDFNISSITTKGWGKII